MMNKGTIKAGIMRYQDHPPRYQYRLTPKGADLGPVLKALSGWGERYVAGTRRYAVPVN